MEIKKILCFCGSGLGTSFLIEMNVKKDLAQLGIQGVEVTHSSLDNVMPGAADLFVCSTDLVANAEAVGKTAGIANLMSIEEIAGKLKEVFN